MVVAEIELGKVAVQMGFAHAVERAEHAASPEGKEAKLHAVATRWSKEGASAHQGAAWKKYWENASQEVKDRRRAATSAAHKGKVLSDETKAKIRAARLGKSYGRKGKKMSEQGRQNVKAAQRLRRQREISGSVGPINLDDLEI